MERSEEQIASNLRDRLSEFPLYENNHWLGVVVKESIYVSYAPTYRRRDNIRKTRFDIQIDLDVCYILSFNIDEERRRERHGSRLAKLIVDFCFDEFGTKRFVATPSGMSKEYKFWEEQGFRYFNEAEVEKILT